MKAEHISTTVHEAIPIHDHRERETAKAGNRRGGTEFVLVCWETFSENPTVYHPASLAKAREIGESKMRFCPQVVLQFWYNGFMYAQQTARTAEQARNFGNKTMIYQRYW